MSRRCQVVTPLFVAGLGRAVDATPHDLLAGATAFYKTLTSWCKQVFRVVGGEASLQSFCLVNNERKAVFCGLSGGVPVPWQQKKC